MIYNITPETFGGAVRNGDLIAVCNVVEYFRHKFDKTTKFHMLPGSINPADYCGKFYEFLLNQTDYFSEVQGDEPLLWKRVNLWDFREISGDLVRIHNSSPMEKKIAIFPVIGAQYNTYRNWPGEVLISILNGFNVPQYDGYEKIVCTELQLNVEGYGFKNSTDFMDNIHHIMTTEIYVGGDTGTSHFAFALDRGPKSLKYHNSGRGLVHTLPFYLMQGKGENAGYWLNYENTTWN
jgi:hypothetical protein